MVMDTTLSDPMVGRLLEGRYSIQSFIAHGGMASVYLATDTRLERRVAVKVMHAHLSDDPETVARFEREARAAARLSSPDVVAVYDQGTDAGRAFLVMEFVPGTNLRQILRDRRRLTTGEAVAVMDHVLAALAAAHAAGLVHRDVKPENVLVTTDGRVKVADFGLARAVAATTVTTTDSVVFGTAAYLAPEQFEYGTADARSDVYAAGVLFFELLTGSPPFEADSAYALLQRHVNEDVPAPSTRASGIPPQIDALVTWATSRDPRQRPADAGELHDSLTDVRDRLGLHGTVPVLPVALTTRLMPPGAGAPNDDTRVVPGRRPPGGPAAPRRRRRGGLIATLVVAVLVVLAGLAGWWFAAGRYTHVPNVINMRPAAAASALKAAGLHERLGQPVHSTAVVAGLVASVSPSGRVLHGATITVQLSSGPVTHPVPILTNESVARATHKLLALDINVGEQKLVNSTSVSSGLVVATDPPAGQVVNAGSSVDLIVSKGPPPVVVPVLAGLKAADAEAALTQAGLAYSPHEVYNSTPAGIVISSNPTHPAQVPQGTTVKLLISRGPHLYLVPNVEGQSIDDAIKAIQNAGFVPQARQVLPGGPNRVLQESDNGKEEPHGTTINLYYF
jgi:eukaryotic-like serine/threonine-protein kinase